MNKHKKRQLWLGIGVGLMVPAVVILLSVNALLRQYLTMRIDDAIAETDSLYIRHGSIDLNVYKGVLVIHNVVFQTDSLMNDSVRAYSRLELSKVSLDGVNYYSLFVKREVNLTGITIDGLFYQGILDTKAMEARAAADDIDKATREQFERLLKEAQKHLRLVTLKRLTITNASADMFALETGLHLNVGRLGMELYDLGYSLVDSIPFHLNDSVVQLGIENFAMVMPDSLMNLRVGRVYTDIKKQGVVLEGVRFATDGSEGQVPRPYASLAGHGTCPSDPREHHEVSVDTVRLDSIDLPDMRGKRGVDVGSLRVINAKYKGIVEDSRKSRNSRESRKMPKIDFAALGVKTEEGQMLAMLKQKQEEAMTKQQMKMLELVQEWLDEVKIDRLSIENTSLEIGSLKSKLAVGVEVINVSFNDLGYSLIDSIPYHFSDSAYSIAIGPVSVVTPDGLIKIECNGFEHSNCGPISIGKTRVYHNVNKWKLSHLMGDISTTWIDLTVDTFFTSRVSPFSTVIDRKLWLDSVFVRVSNLDLFVDNRVLTMPKFEMPSKETLLEIKRLFEIDNIMVVLDNMRTEVTGHYSNNGVITVSDASVSMNDIYFDNLNVGRFDAVFPDGSMRMSVGGVHTVKAEHNLVVKDVAFATKDDGLRTEDGEDYHEIRVDSIVVGGVDLDGAYKSKNIGASVLRVVHPQYEGRVLVGGSGDGSGDGSEGQVHDPHVASNSVSRTSPQDPIALKRKAVAKMQQRNALEFVQEWLDYAQMEKIQIERASADVRATNNGFTLRVNDFDLALSGFGFNIDNFIPINVEDSMIDLKYFMSNFRMLGNSAISNLGFRDLRATMPDSSMYLTVYRAYTDRSSSSVVINNVEFATDRVIPEDEMYHKVVVDTIRLDGIVLPDLKGQREAVASALRVIRPHYFGLIDERPRIDSLENLEPLENLDSLEDLEHLDNIDRGRKKQEKALAIIKQFFDGVALDRLSIEDGGAEFSSLVSNLKGKAEGLNISLNDISYDMSDNVYSLDDVKGLKFNDTLYDIGLRNVDVMIPDSSVHLCLNNFRHTNGGPISLGRTHIKHAIDKWEIAHKNGDIPTTWFSMVLDTFYTSAIRPIDFLTTLRDEGKGALDSVIAVIDTMTIFRDMRFKPKEPYVMPHKPMMSIDTSWSSVFSLSLVDAKINRMEVQMAMTDSCVASLALDSIWGVLRNLALERGGNINIIGGGKLGTGVASVEANIGLRPEYPWDIKLQATGLDLSALNGLTFPVVGLNVGGVVRELRAEYGGDSAVASGVMMMRYNDLTAVFSKVSPSPYKFIGKYYWFFNSCARTLITHNNPTREGRKVRAYKVGWKNDPWQPAAMFMVGPIIKGAIESLLPGLFISNRVKLLQQ